MKTRLISLLFALVLSLPAVGVAADSAAVSSPNGVAPFLEDLLPGCASSLNDPQSLASSPAGELGIVNACGEFCNGNCEYYCGAGLGRCNPSRGCQCDCW